jgi:hypothetical protein
MKDVHLAMRNFYDDCFALSMEFIATLWLLADPCT